MFHERWETENRKLTRAVFKAIEGMPTPAKTAMSLIPILGNLASLAHSVTENHKFAIVRLAQRLDEKGKLGPEARRHLRGYQRALAQEQKEYNAFLKVFEDHL